MELYSETNWKGPSIRNETYLRKPRNACQIYKRVQMVSEQPNMNCYTHSEWSTQTWESQENSETEESDFRPCLIGGAPPIMSHPPPITLPSHYRAATSSIQYTTKTHRRCIKWRVRGTPTKVSSTTEHRAWADKYCQYGWCNCNRIAYKGSSIYFLRIVMLMENVTVRAMAIFLFRKSLY